jgi:hypothetical protein
MQGKRKKRSIIVKVYITKKNDEVEKSVASSMSQENNSTRYEKTAKKNEQ